MWLIAKKQSGKDPPAALTPDMVPPSMRPKVQNDVSTQNFATIMSPILLSRADISYSVHFQGMSSIYNNPELEMMANEIQAMLVEKLQIEKECQERQATTYIPILITFSPIVFG